MSRPDLNLLGALDVLLAEGSVARAAQRLLLSPSAMSRTLARLREAEADYTTTWGSGDLYGEAADVLDAARRLWPLIERSTKGLVFTADRAGEVMADMATLRKALVA
jgi:hypothetical protein